MDIIICLAALMSISFVLGVAAGRKSVYEAAKEAVNDIVADYFHIIKEQQNKIEILEKQLEAEQKATKNFVKLF